MKMRIVAVFLLALSQGTALGGDQEWSVRAQELNRDSIAKLGIDIRSVAMLFEATDISFVPKWALEGEGKMPSLKKLELGKFVTVEIVRLAGP